MRARLLAFLGRGDDDDDDLAGLRDDRDRSGSVASETDERETSLVGSAAALEAKVDDRAASPAVGLESPPERRRRRKTPKTAARSAAAPPNNIA